MYSRKVIVTNISSYNDQNSRTRGREIYLDEYEEEKGGNVQTFTFGPDFINELMKGISQGMGIQTRPSQKIILRLTDEEYESLGIKFEVNDVYSLTFEDGKIEFKREGI
ncbi:MAG: arcadin 1 [Thermoplasmatales archaeon]